MKIVEKSESILSKYGSIFKEDIKRGNFILKKYKGWQILITSKSI